MTTEEIRKAIKVNSWKIDHTGICIAYQKKYKSNQNWWPEFIELGKEDVCAELNAIGEINYYGPNEVEWEGERLDWISFTEEWTFSQWDALNLVIRHEYRKSLDSDMNMLEIDTALNALKNI